MWTLGDEGLKDFLGVQRFRNVFFTKNFEKVEVSIELIGWKNRIKCGKM